MIWFFLLLLILGAVLQVRMADTALNHTVCSIRSLEHLVEPGEPFRLLVTVENHSRLPVFFLRFHCAIPLEAELLKESPGSTIPYVNTCEYQLDCYLMPRQRREFTLSFRLADRGVYRFSNLSMSCGDFLGLREQKASFPGSCSVVILPGQPRHAIHPMVMGGLLGERTVLRWLHEDPILSSGFREYTGREPMKTISWNRSLQSGKLMVRQLDHTTEEKVTVLLCGEGGTHESIEGSLRICRSVCEQLEQKKLPFSFLHSGLVMTDIGKLPPLEDGLGKVHLNRILEGLGRAILFYPGSLDSLIRRTIARNHDACCYVLIVQSLTAQVRQQAQKLEQRTGSHVELLCGEDDI